MAQQRKTKGRRTGSILLDSLFYDPRIAKLSRPAFQLLIEFNQQYSGFNNGNLSATPKTLRFDWNDKTLKRVKRELLQAKLIEVTKRGVGRRPTLYALCHLPIDETSKHGIKAETTCSRRATGKRAHYYPVRRDIASEIAKTETVN
ncbi:hypothetical protein BOW39_12755 [Solemya velum gill symbiont]|uniref:hypothetical protein n=1 Tax=Solemya velum gill symbiont TaxID=2340 RepID=UPI000996897D|nr:hypothetical protein [Solemya velum gill symbiont]OOZ47892.1 hypothetical protein BOW39_12755 [Solemya velum gill symbiont]